MIEIHNSSKVFVVSPSRIYTGGPNLLHQLCYTLRNELGIDAYMYYIDIDGFEDLDKIHSNYREYNNPVRFDIEDIQSNILIVPEVKKGIEILSKYKHIRKVIWWLSVDNFYVSFFMDRPYMILVRILNKLYKIYKKTYFNLIDINKEILKRYGLKDLSKTYVSEIRKVDYHLVQSIYALNHLLSLNFPIKKIYYLSDYIDEDFLDVSYDLEKKEDIVVYNPAKENSFTRKIITLSRKYGYNIEFIPIFRMTKHEVRDLLLRAKVYIDFGNHPGKDRIPREAAILGCCIITGKRGSAAFYEDVPIPGEYKFEDRVENIPLILKKIKDCIENYKYRINDFENYRKLIRKEKQKFIEDLKKIFIRVSNNA